MQSKILNQHQSAEEVRALAIKTYMELDTNKTIRLTYKPFDKGYQRFLVHYLEFEGESKNKSRTTGGTATKGDQKKAIAKHLGTVLKTTKDYAIQSNNSSMKAFVNFSERKINKMNDGDILPFINNLKEKVFTTALFANLDYIDYKVTSIEFAGIVTAAETFNDTRGEVIEDDNSSSTSNDAMDAIIDLLHKDFESMDNTIGRLEESYPEFVAGYNKNKTLVYLGKRHEGVQGVVRKNGVLQPDSFVGVVDSDKSTIADKDAVFTMYMVPGEYMLQAKNANGDAQIKKVTVTYRNMLDVDFELE